MKVLITGINGFVGSYIAKGFLDLNWDVVGTVRSDQKGIDLINQPAFAGYAAPKLSYIVVDHLASYDFSSKLTDVDAIAHTACPCHMNGAKIENYTNVAIKGTSNILMAANASPTVKAVAITSSFGAMLDLDKTALEQSGRTYTEDDWFSMTIEEASQKDACFWYATAKTFAEKKAWEIKNEGTSWSLATICPPSIYGPVIHTSDPEKMNMTSRRLYYLFFGGMKDVMETKYPAFIDVRDVADAHIEAILKKTTGRFITSAGFYDLQRASDFVHREFPKEEVRLTPRSQAARYLKPQQVYSLDSSRVVEVLGLSMRSFEETMRDTFKNYLKIYQDSKPKES